jgi:hypothetical protein
MSAFLGSVLEYYQEIATNGVQRLNKARTRIDAGTYGPTELTSDILGLWIDAVEGWWDSALRPVASALPTAFFKLRVGDASATVPIPVKATQAGNPTVTDLTSAASGQTLQAALHVSAVFVTNGGQVDRTQLEVKLRDLKKYNGTPNTNTPAGLYRGVVFVDTTGLAEVPLLITP